MTDAVPSGSPSAGGISAGAVNWSQSRPSDAAGRIVSELYQRHRLRLVGTALVLVGDRPTAEDVVQNAFAGLHRAMPRLRDPDKALSYVRTSVVDGSRLVHRARLYVLSFRANRPTYGPWALTRFDGITGAASPAISLPDPGAESPWTYLQLGGS